MVSVRAKKLPMMNVRRDEKNWTIENGQKSCKSPVLAVEKCTKNAVTLCLLARLVKNRSLNIILCFVRKLSNV